MYFNHGVLYQRLFLAAVVLFATSQAASKSELVYKNVKTIKIVYQY